MTRIEMWRHGAHGLTLLVDGSEREESLRHQPRMQSSTRELSCDLELGRARRYEPRC